MSLSLILGCVWVVAASFVAMLPMRAQMIPGVALLVAAPVLIGVIGWENGVWWGVIAAIAFLSMFRRPLIHLGRRAAGLPTEDPRDTAPEDRP